MPDDILPTPPLPRWFSLMRSVILRLYLGVIALCVAGMFLIGFGGMIVGRDFGSYTLAGNPWEPSSFPFYIIWPMRLMSIVGVMIAGGAGFVIIGGAILAASGGASSAGPGRRLAASLGALAIEVLIAAWLLR